MFFVTMHKRIACVTLILLLIPIFAFASDMPAAIAKLPDELLMELYRMVVSEMDNRGITHEEALQYASLQQAPSISRTAQPGCVPGVDASLEDVLQAVADTIDQQPYTETFITYDPPATPKPTFAPLIQLAPDDRVWISKTGRRYHTTPDCSGMKKPREVTLQTAIQNGLTPCRDCAYWMAELEE